MKLPIIQMGSHSSSVIDGNGLMITAIIVLALMIALCLVIHLSFRSEHKKGNLETKPYRQISFMLVIMEIVFSWIIFAIIKVYS